MATKTYLGNANLKAIGVDLEFTEDQIQEFRNNNKKKN